VHIKMSAPLAAKGTSSVTSHKMVKKFASQWLRARD
jgi:hypothetical protein